MDLDTWNANEVFFEQLFDSPLCWPNSRSVPGASATWCVCMQTNTGTLSTATVSGNSSIGSLTEALIPTMTGPTRSACAYSSFDQLPKGQYTPPTITPAPSKCVSTRYVPIPEFKRVSHAIPTKKTFIS